MKVTVKILQGQECTVEVGENAGVAELKAKVSDALQVLPSRQRLVFKGKPIPEDKPLSACGLVNGSKIFLVVKKCEGVGVGQSQAKKKPDLWSLLQTYLQKHFTEQDAKLVLQEFKKDFDRTISNLSMDDIERWAGCMLDSKEDA